MLWYMVGMDLFTALNFYEYCSNLLKKLTVERVKQNNASVLA